MSIDFTRPDSMRAEDLPQVRIFQDDFTRQFMQSAEAAERGYYVFESGTGKYEMAIPEESTIDHAGYSMEENNDFESYLINIYHENGVISHLQVTFLGQNDPQFVEEYLTITQSHAGEELEFKKITDECLDLYFSAAQDKRLNGMDQIGYICYLQNLKGPGGMQLYYDTYCDTNSMDAYEEIREAEKEKILKIISSIKFLPVRSNE
ncbi:hypothetical protein [Jeotgalibacillus proteolyticus]|uniref:Uncharacterized protein n=1 Tax=Jeotgalibacillus proteolyticus TaxID=2082395 RepID=A0A2S5GDC8_9BACL|nr:hypothetical protein [Jeotgalibacillus proteolyticus]PPA70914.1 hypothetical protein C4B60_09000 [Jeotgalibacillus proteolyticus]